MALEFRSFKDDAWYDASVVTEGRRNRRLRIKFFNFGDDEDEVVHAKHLNNLDALRSRFRKISSQFQDSDCSRVDPGLLVCAARPDGDYDMKFYDAVLTGVWVDSGETGSCSVGNICRVQNASDEELDPALISFLDKAREGIESASCTLLRLRGRRNSHKDRGSSMASIALSGSVEGMGTDLNPLRISYEVAHHTKERHEDTSTPRGSLALSCYVEGGALYMVIVENLEKEISPFTIMEFIQQQVSITCRASVSASKSSELYTRAIILLDSKENLEKLSDFLESPDHVIISSAGRPWLVTEKKRITQDTKAINPNLHAFISNATGEKNLSSNELSVVLSGTREYIEAKELQIMFKEFTKHQCGLQRGLHLEEGKIYRSTGEWCKLFVTCAVIFLCYITHRLCENEP